MGGCVSSLGGGDGGGVGRDDAVRAGGGGKDGVAGAPPGEGRGTVDAGAPSLGSGNTTVLSVGRGALGALEGAGAGGGGGAVMAGKGMTPVVMEMGEGPASGACAVIRGKLASPERPSDGKGMTPVVIDCGGGTTATEPVGVRGTAGRGPDGGRGLRGAAGGTTLAGSGTASCAVPPA